MSRPRERSERAQWTIFWPLSFIVLPLLRVLMKQRITGAENLPRTGPFILVPNHYSEIDPIVIAAAVWKSGRIPRFMAKASLFRIPVVGAVLRAAGQIPVERGGASRGHDPVAMATELVRAGTGVIVYPEGTLTRDPELWPMRGKTGAARLALAHELPVIPVVHWGTQKVMPRYGKKISLFPPKRVDIRFGEPIDLTPFRAEPVNSAILAGATDEIMARITALLAEVRGEQAPTERWNPSEHDQRETGRFDS
ncbi:lysophospholipid acyltransferase family protein [Mycetocola reblochoni]|uniref:1-acyl-sn-glycerol-3-phosphate acyltransferase n=2 Tax=Mycetocola reblochoni TaxID=331618 RepID=A0A1R4JB58_9MICO|nr:lysophospholipid acyltransferase family protein [Mycetocola reblochoni]RLP70021.1 1-acyl-sn-glycerol-3-phosphate acyltransferase [Mycetocola reblochoni]SJN29219.1 1-acyl-sn-glycerol-3-phosphate acyltransferase [Mycetocola reblochoni REB411]